MNTLGYVLLGTCVAVTTLLVLKPWRARLVTCRQLTHAENKSSKTIIFAVTRNCFGMLKHRKLYTDYSYTSDGPYWCLETGFRIPDYLKEDIQRKLAIMSVQAAAFPDQQEIAKKEVSFNKDFASEVARIKTARKMGA